MRPQLLEQVAALKVVMVEAGRRSAAMSSGASAVAFPLFTARGEFIGDVAGS